MKNEYYFKARLIPTILTMVPLVVIYVYVLSPILDNILKPIWYLLPLLAGVSLNTAVMFLLVLLNRFVSKKVFQNLIYQDELYMPTTNYLMPDDRSLDKVTRNRYYDIILRDFNIDLKRNLRTLKDEKEKRIMITKVVALIRKMLIGNHMLLQHNIEYGFWRNLLGGCVLAAIESIVLFVFAAINTNHAMIATSVILFCVYLLPILFSKTLVKAHGQNYAKILFEQYEAQSGVNKTSAV